MAIEIMRLFVLCVCCALLQSCTLRVAGGTDTGHGHEDEVSGTLYEPDGTMPAGNAAVRMRPAASFADTSGASSADIASVKTDENGRFAINGVDTGTYVIEAADCSNNRAIIRPVRIANKDFANVLGPDTLMPSGALRGKIFLSEGGDPRKVLILSIGIDKFARVNADGSFLFKDLARGSYGLRILPVLPDYDVLDTNGFTVSTGDTTDLGIIQLHFSGIPTPNRLSIAYDTMKQIVTLMWSKPDSALVKGFNVYRRNVDSNSLLKQINTNPVTDTIYRDSSGVQDQSYEYRVAAVDKNDMEGTKSAGVSVEVTGAFVVADTLIQTNAPMGTFAIDSKGFFYLTNLSSNSIEVFDPNGSKAREWVVSRKLGFDYIRASNLFIDNKDNLFIYTYYDSIMVFDTLGTKLKSFGASIGSCEGIVFFGDTCYVAVEQPNREILLFDSDGKQINTIKSNWGISDNFYSMIRDSINHLCLWGGFGTTNDRNRIELIDKNGTLTGSIMQTAGLPDGAISLAKGTFLLASSNAVFSFDLNNHLLLKFCTPSAPIKAISNETGNILVGFKQGLIVKYKR
jgi:hypothetical protein